MQTAVALTEKLGLALVNVATIFTTCYFNLAAFFFEILILVSVAIMIFLELLRFKTFIRFLLFYISLCEYF